MNVALSINTINRGYTLFSNSGSINFLKKNFYLRVMPYDWELSDQ